MVSLLLLLLTEVLVIVSLVPAATVPLVGKVTRTTNFKLPPASIGPVLLSVTGVLPSAFRISIMLPAGKDEPVAAATLRL
ncbi:hypothetical protein D3C73_1331200 [compost metagenome]